MVVGQVTEILGSLHSSPTAVTQGGTVRIPSGVFGKIEGLHAWIGQCFLYGRPLAPSLDAAWAWWLALATLGLYLLIAAVFQDGVRRCAQTLEAHPGPSVLATLVAALLVPVVLMALVITVVGVAIIPLFWIALLCMAIFGRVVALGCFLSLLIAGLGFIWIAVDREHQAWHDKIAGTWVVRVPKGTGLL